ncbi:MAG TPA: TM0106 family RecB-like putative nuclease [Candidatus Limnocylindrales bacterium]|nr:TM0106 family RecB-like putative nuclease [Candidatus Limnocylindrales bacterium]
MQLIDGRPVYAATDLVGFLACSHRLALERAAMMGLVAKPIRNDPSIELVAKRGLEHERRYLEDLVAEGRRVVRIEKDGSAVAPLGTGEVTTPRDAGEDLREAARQTIEAMRGGADVIYQATFFDGRWRGHADFLLRRDHAADEPDSPLGRYHYEVADTKLARHVKAGAILQICSYVDMLTGLQGVEPEYLHVVLGGRQRPTDRQRVDDFMAYFRRVKAEFGRAVGLPGDDTAGVAYPPVGTYPEPVEHCDVCRWNPRCRAQRRADDDLSLVAGASSRQRTALKARGVTTRRGLAGLQLPLRPPLEGVGAQALERVHEQARIQVEGEDADEVLWELLPVERTADGVPVEGRGLLGLPEPSPNDLFLDLEGDPFALDDGVDYLFGILEPGRLEEDPAWMDPSGAPTPAFHAIWSLDEAGQVTWASEKSAFERTIDLIMDRWERDPSLHVYHYAAYERTALGRLAQRHGTRELEVDRLLRGGVLVDLFRAVRQGIRASVESYSIKRIEPLYSLHREVELKDAGSSIVAFETWLELGPDAPVEDADEILRGIAGYNRDDVLSNWRLRDWLEDRRRDLQVREREIFARPNLDDGAPSAELGAKDQHVLELMERLAGDVDPDPLVRAADADANGRWLLAQLLAWHRREEKSSWWRWYALQKMSEEELLGEREAISGLRVIGDPRPEKKSLVWSLGFPPQEHKIEPGAEVTDPATGKGAGEIVAIDDVRGILELKRGPKLDGVPLPRSVILDLVVPTPEQAESILRVGEWVATHGLSTPRAVAPGTPSLDAARALLLRRRPEPALGPDGDLRLAGETALDAGVRIATVLDGAVLPIQGPPGSGKTHTGAHMIAALVADGQKVGVVANSHKVIGNLLRKVAEEAAILGVAVRVGQKPKSDEPPTFAGAIPISDNAEVAAALRQDRIDVVGAVAWTWARAEMAGPAPVLDVLFVDEAGQMSLANVLACAPAARSIVLLGDPQQLDQPTQGSHPPGAERSALAHLLGDRATIAPTDGLFLEETWRLHPAICRFTSEAFYAGRLGPRPGNERQVVTTDRDTLFADGPSLDGAGVRHVPVEHAGNDTDSAEEAAAVVALVRDLLASNARWTDPKGVVRPMTADDIVVVAPYNAHVATIERAFLAAGIPDAFVGTVDRFQGQERPVSVYAMGTSAPEDAPRGMEFLYSLNRLNVATSRARCVATVVCSPALLRVACRTPRQMQLANGLCLAVEAAGIVTP